MRGEVRLMSRDDYVRTLIDFLELLPPQMVVERISGDAPPQYLISPKWCLEKSLLKRQIESECERRGTRQGACYRRPALLPPDRPRPADNTPDSIRSQIDVRGRLPVLKMER